MPRPTRQEALRIAERRKRVAELHLRRVPNAEIARREGVAPPQITRDLAAVRKDWLEQARLDFDARQAEELARIDALEITAWKAWRRSCRAAVTVQKAVEAGLASKEGVPLPDRKTRRRTRRGQAGDPRFLERIAWCIDQRCRLFGLAPTGDNKVLNYVGSHNVIYTPEERRAIEEAIFARMGLTPGGDPASGGPAADAAAGPGEAGGTTKQDGGRGGSR
jgi:hypothetical protein